LEIEALGAVGVQAVKGGVQFRGPYSICYTINLESRIASRVLWRVGFARYRSEKDVYEAACGLGWCDWFDASRTIRVNVSAIRSPLQSLDFTTLRIKDAVCDVFRAKTSRRPDVNTRNPDVRIQAFLTADDCTFYLDTSGEALFKRGHRRARGDAPMRENLAAGILRLVAWQPGVALFDPMCGGGTLLMEAAMIAGNMAPGAYRRFGFEKLKVHDRGAWQSLRDRTRSRKKTLTEITIYGSDQSREAINLAHENLAAIGMEDAVSLNCANVLESSPPVPSGLIVTNPPYGVRMDEEKRLAEFYPQLGNVLKKKYSGWTAYIFTADMRLPKLIRLNASKRTPLFNGALDCRLFEFKLVAGSNRKIRKALTSAELG
jgi:putative N6-adenine-specific DNA methylase